MFTDPRWTLKNSTSSLKIVAVKYFVKRGWGWGKHFFWLWQWYCTHCNASSYHIRNYCWNYMEFNSIKFYEAMSYFAYIKGNKIEFVNFTEGQFWLDEQLPCRGIANLGKYFEITIRFSPHCCLLQRRIQLFHHSNITKNNFIFLPTFLFL